MNFPGWVMLIEDIPVDKTRIAYVDPSEPSGNSAGIRFGRETFRSGFRQRDQLGRSRRLVKPLLTKHLAGREPVIGDDLAHPEMIIAEDLGPALLLNFVVTRARAPADHRLLVPPDRKRQQPTLSAQAGKALVVDKPVDLFQLGPQQFGVAEIGLPPFRLGVHFEDHREHDLLLVTMYRLLGRPSERINTADSVVCAMTSRRSRLSLPAWTQFSHRSPKSPRSSAT